MNINDEVLPVGTDTQEQEPIVRTAAVISIARKRTFPEGLQVGGVYELSKDWKEGPKGKRRKRRVFKAGDRFLLLTGDSAGCPMLWRVEPYAPFRDLASISNDCWGMDDAFPFGLLKPATHDFDSTCALADVTIYDAALLVKTLWESGAITSEQLVNCKGRAYDFEVSKSAPGPDEGDSDDNNE